MATYNKNKPKSNVAKSAKKSSFKFKWWMAVVGVGIIALVGIVVLRFSHAGTNDVVGKMDMYAVSKDGRFYSHYWVCRDRSWPFTTVLASYSWGSNIKETYTGLGISPKVGEFSNNSYSDKENDKGSTFFSILADMRLTNYLTIYIGRKNPDKHAWSNPVRVGTLPYCK